MRSPAAKWFWFTRSRVLQAEEGVVPVFASFPVCASTKKVVAVIVGEYMKTMPNKVADKHNLTLISNN
jgi:hypothetical protein